MKLEEIKQTNKYQEATILFLENNNLFKDQFIKFAPQISTEIESAYGNPTCSCHDVIIQFINENSDDFLNFLYTYLIENNKIISFVDILLKIPTYVSLIGKVIKTSISEWENFSKTLKEENSYFNFFSVVKEKDDILVFFL